MSSKSSKRCLHVDLPTEVLCEIFFHLPSVKPVYQFRCVSKLWNSLLIESSFVEKMSKILASEIPWIFMYDPSDIRVQLYLKQDTHKSMNRHDGCLSFEFLLDTNPFNEQKLEKVCILDSCSNGLVLYSPYALEDSHDSAQENSNSYTFLCICNPLTKQWISLPPKPDNGFHVDSYYCTKLVCEYSTCNYKVVCVYTDTLRDNLCFQVFSSDTGEWKMFSSPRNLWRHIEFWYGFSDMVIRHGVLYWTGQVRGPDRHGKILIGYSILDNNKDANDGFMSMDLPMKIDHAYKDDDGKRVFSFFGESGGSIFYCGQIEHSTVDYKAFVSVYRIDQDDHANGGLFNWETVHKDIELKGYRSSKVEAIYINPVDPNVIIIVDGNCCLAYNITTLRHEILHGCPIHKISEDNEKLPPILIRLKPTVIPPLFK